MLMACVCGHIVRVKTYMHMPEHAHNSVKICIHTHNVLTPWAEQCTIATESSFYMYNFKENRTMTASGQKHSVCVCVCVCGRGGGLYQCNSDFWNVRKLGQRRQGEGLRGWDIGKQ